MEGLVNWLRFASEADIALLWAGVFAVLALVALVVDQRRIRRAMTHRSSLVPWTGLFIGCLFIAGGLALLGIRGLAAG